MNIFLSIEPTLNICTQYTLAHNCTPPTHTLHTHCTHTHTHSYTHSCTLHTHMHTNTHPHTHCTHTQSYTHNLHIAHTHMHTSTGAHTRTAHIRNPTHTHTHTILHAHTHTHNPTRTHTHVVYTVTTSRMQFWEELCRGESPYEFKQTLSTHELYQQEGNSYLLESTFTELSIENLALERIRRAFYFI